MELFNDYLLINERLHETGKFIIFDTQGCKLLFEQRPWHLSLMPLATLDYAPRIEFDTGRFVARYFQVLAWLAIASMIAGPIFFDSLHIDVSPIFLFWAASALKRRSRAARKWVLAVTGLLLGTLLLMLLVALFKGTHGMTLSYGAGTMKDPALWQLAAFVLPMAAVLGVPFAVLMSEHARWQFAGARGGA